MNIILVVGILLVIISFLFGKKCKPFIGFTVVFIIMGFQDGVDGDFMEYMNIYNSLSVDDSIVSRMMGDEPILPYLMKIFAVFTPYWFFILCLSLFQVFVLNRFVMCFTPKSFQFIAAILFFFTFNMMLLQMKALRQGLAIELTLASVLLIERNSKKIPLGAIVIMLMAFFTHNSSLIAVPFIFLFYSANKNPKFFEKIGNNHMFPILTVGVYFITYFTKTTLLNDYLGRLSELNEDFRLLGYLGETEIENSFDISWLIVLYNAVIIYIVSWYYRFADAKMRVFALASIVAAFGDMLFFGIGSLPRLIMYLVVYNLVVYPAVTLHIKKKLGRLWAIGFITFLLGYAIKTSLPWILGIDDGRFGTYHFIFFSNL